MAKTSLPRKLPRTSSKPTEPLTLSARKAPEHGAFF